MENGIVAPLLFHFIPNHFFGQDCFERWVSNFWDGFYGKKTVTMVRFQCRLFTLTRSEPRVSPQRFQSGPFASGAFTTVPYTADTSYPSHPIRLLMLKRLQIPLPLSECTCRCRRNVDPLGDHRAACSRTRVLRTRGIPLEQTAARICRAARARVTTHTRVSDLNPPTVQQVDDQGLPLYNGSQLAIGTTLVAPLASAGQPRRRGRQYAAAAD